MAQSEKGSVDDRVKAVSARMDSLYKELGVRIHEFEAFLVARNVGVEVTLQVKSTDDDAEEGRWIEELRFQKYQGRWRLVARSYHDLNEDDPDYDKYRPLADASLEIRELAVKWFPQFLETWVSAAEKRAEQLEETVEVAQTQVARGKMMLKSRPS